MRGLLVLALALFVLVVVMPLLRGWRLRLNPAPGANELVKDPVCQTYVVRSRAVSRETASGLRHFCSAECAGRFRG